jgi:hypothetical protein
MGLNYPFVVAGLIAMAPPEVTVKRGTGAGVILLGTFEAISLNGDGMEKFEFFFWAISNMFTNLTELSFAIDFGSYDGYKVANTVAVILLF